MRRNLYRTKKDLITDLIGPTDSVLDVGFFGQGIGPESSDWVHSLLKARAREAYGVDLDFDESKLSLDRALYHRMSAEHFDLGRTFDVIFAGDLIEHLSNPGLFLACAKRHLDEQGRMILTTPNAFNLFTIAEKCSKGEPTVNPDHTCYFNSKTLAILLAKNGWKLESVSFLYSLGALHRESWKKKFLNSVYWLVSRFTPKFIETLVVVARPA